MNLSIFQLIFLLVTVKRSPVEYTSVHGIREKYLKYFTVHSSS